MNNDEYRQIASQLINIAHTLKRITIRDIQNVQKDETPRILAMLEEAKREAQAVAQYSQTLMDNGFEEEIALEMGARYQEMRLLHKPNETNNNDDEGIA